jgi:flagellar biosynthesis component FlhA
VHRPLAVHGTFVVTITGSAPSTQGTIANTATVSGNENDPNSSNNTASASVVVAQVAPVPGLPVLPFALLGIVLMLVGRARVRTQTGQ